MLQGLGGMDELFEKDPGFAQLFQNSLPVALVEAQDISNAILFLVSDSGRYITGAQLPVDAGLTIR